MAVMAVLVMAVVVMVLRMAVGKALAWPAEEEEVEEGVGSWKRGCSIG
jgi:hypothetical protein